LPGKFKFTVANGKVLRNDEKTQVAGANPPFMPQISLPRKKIRFAGDEMTSRLGQHFYVMPYNLIYDITRFKHKFVF